jgi:hypothetical protein
MATLTIAPGAVVEPVEQVVGQLDQLYRWALRRPHDDPVTLGVVAAVRWLSGRRGVGPMTDRPTPDDLVPVRVEYAVALSTSRKPGSTSRRATGAALVLAVACGDLGQVPDLVASIGAGAPFEVSITFPYAA